MAKLAVWLGTGVLTAGLSAALLAGAGTAAADTDGTAGAGTASSTVAGERPLRAVGSTDEPSGPPTRRTSRVVDNRRTEAARDPGRGEKAAARRSAAAEGLEPTSVLDAPRPRPLGVVDRAPAPEPLPTRNSGEAGIVGDIIGPFQPDYPPPVRAVGSLVFNVLGALVRTLDGPPVVPAGLRDSIEVSTSTLDVAPGTNLEADWYFPKQGQPQRLIYLQHGILATGPMYSHTAALLAERTNSVVVATTITSNPFADDNMWLGGDAMHQAVAQLLLDEDRRALNASLSTAAAKAGRSDLVVPAQFVLVGHSLGGGFAPGVAGHYAEGLVARRADGQDAANHLAGAVLLDAVPFPPILPNAMERLNRLQASNGGDPDDYVPVYEIGAPLNLLNSFSTVNRDLTRFRPGKFNGVVVNGGVHVDAQLGGNPLIQLGTYLVAGVPLPQNPPAVQRLMAGWINDMFAGRIDPTTGRCLGNDCAGTYGAPGETLVLPGDGAVATAVVIDSGTLPPAVSATAGQQLRSVASQIAV